MDWVIDRYIRAIELLERVLWVIALILGALMVVFITVNVTLRYGFGSSVVWVNEVSTYLAIWVALLLLPVLVYRDNNLQIEIFFKQLSSEWQYRIRLIELVGIVFIGLFLLIAGYEYATTAGFRARLLSIDVYRFWVYVILPIGGLLLILFTGAKIIEIIRDPGTIQRDYEARYTVEEA